MSAVDPGALRLAIDPMLANATEMLGSIADKLGSPSEVRADRPWLPTRLDPTIPGLQALFDEVGEEVAPLTQHEHPLVRRQALSVLAIAPSEAATQALVAAASSTDPDVRGRALNALSDHNPSTAAPVLRAALTDASPLVRLYAWAGLSGAGSGDGLEDLAFAEPDPAAAAWAFRTLGELGAMSVAARLLDVASSDEEHPIRAQGAIEGLKALGSDVLALVKDRLPGPSPAATWRLYAVLDANDALNAGQVSPLLADATPLEIRLEAAAWLANHGDAAGREVLVRASEEGPALDRVRGAAKRIRVGDNDALLLILPLWFGPEAIRPTVRQSLLAANRAADRSLVIYAKLAARKPATGAGVIELIRLRGVSDVHPALVAAATANASDDLTRAAIAALFATGSQDASELLTAELDRRSELDQARWASGLTSLHGPVPSGLTDLLLARPEALVVTIGLELLARQPRSIALVRLNRALSDEVDRIRDRAPARDDLGTFAIGGDAAYLGQVRSSSAKLRTQLADNPAMLSAFDELEEATWVDPSGMIVAAIVSMAIRGGLVELSARFDELLARNTRPHLRLRAVYALAALAPWRLIKRDLAPDADGLLARVRTLTR